MVIVIACVSSSLRAEPIKSNDHQTIFWQTYHRPPGIIKTGEDQGTGFVENALKLITNQMPEYTHEFPISSLTRALTDMKANKNVCHPALYKTKERSKFITFSKASIINPGNRIIALKGTLGHLADGNNTIDLKKLLASQEFAFSLIKERSYGQAVDDKIGQHFSDGKSQLLASTDLGTVFNMVLKKRVDFTISFPFELNYFVEKNGIDQTQLVSYFIKDIPKFTLGYVACPKNEWGKSVIKKVNKVLSKTKLENDYKRAVTSWWGSEQFSKEFETFYQTQFLTH